MSRSSLRRIWLVARRDYVGYLKTWGFWISFALPIAFGLLGILAAQAGIDLQNVRYETVLDETGQGVGEDMLADYRASREALRERAVDSMPEALRESADQSFDEADRNLVFVPPPADTLEGLQPFLRDERRITVDGREVRLAGALQIVEVDGRARARYWSSNVNADTLPNIARRYFRRRAQENYLATGGLTLEGLNAALDTSPIEKFDPTKTELVEDAQQVTFTDRLPYYIAAGASAFLWFTVFSGAYMLLTSMLEEKLGKLMETMLATTRFVEIMLGKLLGVALLTVTAMAPYIILLVTLLVVALTYGDPEVVAGIRDAVSLKMLIFFPVFLVLGYTFYGCLFIALGSFAESMQDAQTLTIPILLVLTACVLVVPAGLSDPNAPLVVIASWVPLSAPFAAIIRLPADPGWGMLMGSALLMALATVLVAWLATIVFRQGVLSGGGLRSLWRSFTDFLFGAFRRAPL